MARSTAARRSALTFGEPRSTSETRDLETPARSATSRMVGRGAGSSPLTGIGDLRGWPLERSTERSLAHATGPGSERNTDPEDPNALKPGFHGVRTHWIRRFM